MKISLYQIGAFTSRLFSGNPAAVCPLEQWLEDEILQSIAAENNLSETAFFIRQGDEYHIRWFTPVTEVDLCGHATLASAYVIFNELQLQKSEIIFNSRSGKLKVVRQNGLIVMDFPSLPPVPCHPVEPLIKAFGVTPLEILKADDYLLVFSSEAELADFEPDMELLRQVDLRGVIVSAPGTDCDFVSRFFAPKYGIPEDPVTGSAHCTLAPYWSKKLGKTRLKAIQISDRRGELFCEVRGDRVLISGQAVKYLEGTLNI
ncbi:MAG: PhzF family phenazine biosynthesis protein [SAR324 cluster bacterium]|nr:PhzF family phenazine biosynthesis protein [SAR324 cluster bacterium]